MIYFSLELNMKRDITNIPPGETKCSICGITKDNFEFSFYKNRFTENTYRLMVNTNCKTCSKIRGKERATLRKKFSNITQPEYGTSCELCGKPVYRNWQLDHCHITGNFRGWICKPCNTGLGSLGDTKEAIKRAAEYLERSENNANPSQQNNLLGERLFS